MTQVHVCLVSDQTIPNMTTILQFQPEVVVLLYTKGSKLPWQRLKTAICLRGLNVDSVLIEAYDINNVVEETTAIIKKYRGHEISLNITGGTKIGALGSFQAFYTAGLPIFYVNTAGHEILQVSPCETSQKIAVHIPAIEYLGLYGFKVGTFTDSFETIEKRVLATTALTELVTVTDYAIGELNESIQKMCPGGKTAYVAYPLIIRVKNKKLRSAAEVLRDAGILSSFSDNEWTIPDKESADYLHGFWFEEYVALCAKKAGADEVLLNVTGEWATEGKESPRNEFDVMISKGNQLYFISCKTSDPNRKKSNQEESISKEYLYELDSLGDRALGLFGRKMLASARPVTNTYVRKRAIGLQISLIDGQNIKMITEKIKEWLKR